MELLVPAGRSLPLIRQLLAAGADAIYFGVKNDGDWRPSFSTRPSSVEFRLADGLAAVRSIVAAGRRAYITFNSFFPEDKLPEATRLALQLHRAGAAAFIVADPGLARRLRQACPDLVLHASIVSNTANAEAALFWKELGVSRIILERCLSLDEIVAIKRGAAVEVEVFVYGAFCFHYSSVCAISNYLYGEWCLGPCMERAPLPELPEAGQTPFKSKLLNAYEMLPAFYAAGVDGVKIEGRQKSPRYVRTALAALRPAIDAVQRGEPLPPARRSLFFLSPPRTTVGYYPGDPAVEDTLVANASVGDRLDDMTPYLFPDGLRYAFHRRRIRARARRHATRLSS